MKAVRLTLCVKTTILLPIRFKSPVRGHEDHMAAAPQLHPSDWPGPEPPDNGQLLGYEAGRWETKDDYFHLAYSSNNKTI